MDPCSRISVKPWLASAAHSERYLFSELEYCADNMAEEKTNTKKVEEGAEKSGEVVGKGIKAGIGGLKGLGKGIKEGVKKDEEKK